MSRAEIAGLRLAAKMARSFASRLQDSEACATLDWVAENRAARRLRQHAERLDCMADRRERAK